MQNVNLQQRNEPIPTYPTFNPLTHIPPSYDLYGHQIPINRNKVQYNILSEKEDIKTPWDSTNPLSQSTPMTRTKLLELRKKENIPDISYDLDGDGYVGGRDYVLSKRFDVDGDGKLNEIEKKNALEAIKNGVEREYVWNLENQGGKRYFRILQKRGKIIDAENFVPLQESYPKHPISFKEPKNGVHTLNELKEYRKNKTKEEISEKVKKFHKEHTANSNNNLINENNYYFPEMKEKPKYSSINDIRDELHKEARKKVGLNENESDIKNYDLSPTLKYVYSPKHKTKGDIKKDLIKESQEISKILNSRKHLNEIERLKQREDEIFNKLFQSEEGFTLTKLKEQRRLELNKYNLKTFAHRPRGVHGHELPKFSANENTKEFWKLREGYVENPKHKSQLEYLQEIKYWKKPEELLLSEHRDYIEPKREKRAFTLPNKVKDDITPNINQINFYKGFDPSYVKPIDYKVRSVHRYRWTSLMDKFLSGKFKSGRLFEALENEDKKKEAENAKKIKKEEIKETKEDEKNKVNVEIPPEKPLFQKFGSKEGINLTSSTEVRNKGF
jgi:hypothetical protein